MLLSRILNLPETGISRQLMALGVLTTAATYQGLNVIELGLIHGATSKAPATIPLKLTSLGEVKGGLHHKHLLQLPFTKTDALGYSRCFGVIRARGEGQLGCIRWTSVCNRTLIIQMQYVVYSVNRTNELVPMG